MCDNNNTMKCEVGSLYPTTHRMEKVSIDRTSQLLVSTAIAIADIIKIKAKRKAYVKQK